MTRNARVTFLGAALLFAVVGAFRAEQYLIARNYPVHVHVPCDPGTHSCFETDCEIGAEIGCTGRPYAKVTVAAAEAPACLEEHACESFSCDGRASCAIEYCQPARADIGEWCSSARPNVSRPEPAEPGSAEPDPT